MTKNNENKKPTVEEQVSKFRKLVWDCQNEISAVTTKSKQAKIELERAYIAESAKKLKEFVEKEKGQVTERDFITFLNDLAANLRDTWR